MTYAPIPNEDVDVGSPLSTALMTALRDSPIQITQMEDGAPILQNGWYPYDQTEIGGTGDGIIYDHSVDGSINSFDTPDFEVGYDYRIEADGLTATANEDVEILLYDDVASAFVGPYTTEIFVSSTGAVVGFGLEIYKPKTSSRFIQLAQTHEYSQTLLSAMRLGSREYTVLNVFTAYKSTASTVGKLRLQLDSFRLFTAGTVKMYRRKVAL